MHIYTRRRLTNTTEIIFQFAAAILEKKPSHFEIRQHFFLFFLSEPWQLKNSGCIDLGCQKLWHPFTHKFIRTNGGISMRENRRVKKFFPVKDHRSLVNNFSCKDWKYASYSFETCSGHILSILCTTVEIFDSAKCLLFIASSWLRPRSKRTTLVASGEWNENRSVNKCIISKHVHN